MKKLLYGVLSLSLIAGALSFGGNQLANKSTSVKPSILKRENVSTTLGIQTMAKAVWNNNGANITSNEAFEYGFYSGQLNCGSGSSFTQMLKSDASEGNLTSASGDANVDWGGVRFTSKNNERVMTVFIAKKNMTIQAKANSVSDWDSDYSFYVFDSLTAIHTGEGVWNAGALKKTFKNTTDASNLPEAYNLVAGNVYVFEWGFQWGDSRTWQCGDAALTFEISTENTPVVPTTHEKVLYYTDMHYFVKANNGGEYGTDVSPFKSFGFYYKTKDDATLKPVSVVDGNLSYTGAGDFKLENWRMTIDNQAAFVIKMTANEKVLFETYRQGSGNEWDANITLKVYTDTKVIKDSKLTGGMCDEYLARSVVDENESVYWEISAFQIDNGSNRNIAMLGGGSVQTTLPEFKMTPFAESSHEHSMTSIAGTSSTCETKGHKGYYQCSICDEYFEDHDGETPIADIDEWLNSEGAKALADHTITKVNGESATCEKAGYKDYYKCSVCEKLFADEAATTPIDDLDAWKANEGKIAAKGHTITKVNGEAATCEHAGYNDYYTCSECGKNFVDEAATTPIDNLDAWKANEGKIEKLEHTYGEWAVTKEPTEKEEGSRAKTCSACEDVVTEAIPVLSTENGYTYEVVEEATTEKEGRAKWTSEEYGVFFTTIPMKEKEPEPVDPEEPTEPEEKKGCKGSIVATSIVLSSLALVGASLVIGKKKEN